MYPNTPASSNASLPGIWHSRKCTPSHSLRSDRPTCTASVSIVHARFNDCNLLNFVAWCQTKESEVHEIPFLMMKGIVTARLYSCRITSAGFIVLNSFDIGPHNHTIRLIYVPTIIICYNVWQTNTNYLRIIHYLKDDSDRNSHSFINIMCAVFSQ